MSKILWACEICNKIFTDDEDYYAIKSRVLSLNIPQSGESMDYSENDVFEFKNTCLDCRMKISNAIYSELRNINPVNYPE